MKKEKLELESGKFKQCPNCQQLNMKDDGSLSVECLQCKKEFCWFCLEFLESAKNFHFASCGGRKSMPIIDQVVNGIESTMPTVVTNALVAFTSYIST